MSTGNVASLPNLSELLPKLDTDALRNFLDTGVLPAHTVCTGLQAQCNATGVTQNSCPPEVGLEFSVSGIPEPIPELDNGDFPTCHSQVYSRKYGCWLPGWVYKQGYDI